MKIWVDAREFTPRGRTGIARYLENLFTAYVSSYDDEVILLSQHPACIPDALQAVCEVRQLPDGITGYIDHVVIPRIVGNDPDQLYFSPYYKTPIRGTFRRVSVIHDILFLRRNDLPNWKKVLTLIYLRMCARKVDFIMASSTYTKSDIQQLIPGVAEKIHVLYPDLSPFWFEKVAAADLPVPYFLYVGNFNPHKNVPLLIEAFAMFKKSNPGDKHHLVLVGGDTKHMDMVQGTIRANGLEATVEILQGVGDAKLKALYTGATVMVTASAYEGFGYPVVEAMACGCPVICSKDTSLGEISGNGSISLPVLTAEEISSALMKAACLSDVERDELTAQALIHIKQFSPGQTATNLHHMLMTING